MSGTRRAFGKDFKAKVVLEALKEKETFVPNRLNHWTSLYPKLEQK